VWKSCKQLGKIVIEDKVAVKDQVLLSLRLIKGPFLSSHPTDSHRNEKTLQLN
jgi:hypothetical protein